MWWMVSLKSLLKIIRQQKYLEIILCFISFQFWTQMVLREAIIELIQMELILIDAISILILNCSLLSTLSVVWYHIWVIIKDFLLFWTFMPMQLERVHLSMEIVLISYKNKYKLAYSPKSFQWTVRISNTKLVTSLSKICTAKIRQIICQNKDQAEWRCLNSQKTDRKSVV